MARIADEVRIRSVVRLLEENPGHRPGDYARMMAWHREAFVRVLTQLEDRGVLVSEDRKGRLWLQTVPGNPDSRRAHGI